MVNINTFGSFYDEVVSGGVRYFKQRELKQTDVNGQIPTQSNPFDMAGSSFTI